MMRRRAALSRGALAAGIALAIGLPIAPLSGAGAQAAPVVGCGAAAARTVLTASADLDPTCTYTGGFDITESGVTLDCRGAVIHGVDHNGVGILIRTPASVALHDVTVRNCQVIGFQNSLRVTRDGFRDLTAGHEYDTTTSAIRVTGSRMERSGGVAVYVDGYVSDVTIDHNLLHDAGSTGVYLETGSRQNQVTDNEIIHNGYVENGVQGTPVTFGGANLWFWGTGREGIAVDGSHNNTITGNHLAGNSAGGVFLYDNCGEYKDANPDAYLERRYPAAHNLIQGNSFDGGRNGVWVGSRMGENTLPMECGKPAYVERPGLRVVLDRADHNTIRANHFANVTYGVRVEDDNTTVADNVFAGASADRHAVLIGTPYRTTVLHHPVTGTVLTGNRSTIVGNAWPYRWVDGQAATIVRGNLALGRTVGICRGRDVPRQAFIFTIAVALPLPGGGKPPTPDLTVPEVGALPPCAVPASTPHEAVPAAAGAPALDGSATFTG